MPLVVGEFWAGGRGETRLVNAREYRGREDWHREEARLYREKILEMRHFGVWGIMAHRLTFWPLIEAGPLLSQEACAQGIPSPFAWRFLPPLNEGGRGMAPVVGFVWPRSASVVAGETFEREAVVCNDREKEVLLRVACEYGSQRESWEITLAPAGQARLPIHFEAQEGLEVLRISVNDSDGGEIEHDQLTLHGIDAKAIEPPHLARRVVVVPAVDEGTREALETLQIPFTIAPDLPEDAKGTMVIVPPGIADDALGRDGSAVTQYLAKGGRLLVLAQHQAPRWLPVSLPFSSAVRKSVPEFDGGGWDATNKDLIYSRDIPVYADGHPVLSGLNEIDFKEWSAMDGRISDDVYIRPNAINKRIHAAYRVLLGATRRENASLVELRTGQGTALLCQAQVLRHHDHPAARALLYNQLRYLDGAAWVSREDRVGLLGDLSPANIAALAGIPEDRFTSTSDLSGPPRLVLAGDHADVNLARNLAMRGSTVLVLSCEACSRLPEYAVETEADAFHSGTRAGAAEHPLFWGVSSASFLPLEHTPARGALTTTPADAHVLLAGQGRGHSPFANSWMVDIGFYGLETREAAPPIAVMQRVGRGALIATTLEPWNRSAESHRQLLVNLLANAQVAMPIHAEKTSVVAVKSTVPLEFDGQLNDWTNDMDDINLSVYSHAEPIALTSKDALRGRIARDLDFSALLYLLHDDEHLYLGGIVFGSGRGVKVSVDLHEHMIEIDLDNKAVTLDGQPLTGSPFAVGQQPAGEVIDIRLLDLTKIQHQTNQHLVATDASGQTFELAVPWKALGHAQPPQAMRGRFEISRDEGRTSLCHPATTEPAARYIDLRIQHKSAPAC